MGFLAVSGLFRLQLNLRVLEDLFAITKRSRFMFFIVITSDFKTLKLKSVRLVFTNME